MANKTLEDFVRRANAYWEDPNAQMPQGLTNTQFAMDARELFDVINDPKTYCARENWPEPAYHLRVEQIKRSLQHYGLSKILNPLSQEDPEEILAKKIDAIMSGFVGTIRKGLEANDAAAPEKKVPPEDIFRAAFQQMLDSLPPAYLEKYQEALTKLVQEPEPAPTVTQSGVEHDGRLSSAERQPGQKFH